MKKAVLDGNLIVTDQQEVIDQCKMGKIPVVAWEHDDVKNLVCDQIVLNIDEMDDYEWDRIYRRCMGMPWKILETERCYVREFSMDDLDQLFMLYQKPGVCTFLEPLFEYEEEKAYEENYIEYVYKIWGYGQWLIFLKENGQLIGRAGIESRDTCRKYQAELGYLVDPDYQKMGIGTEICRAIIEYAFEDCQLESLIARTDKDNEASIALLKKLDFEFKEKISADELLFLLVKKP